MTQAAITNPHTFGNGLIAAAVTVGRGWIARRRPSRIKRIDVLEDLMLEEVSRQPQGRVAAATYAEMQRLIAAEY